MSPGAKGHEIRDVAPKDAPQVITVDTTAAAGDGERRASIERWIADGSMRVAVAADEIVGYYVTERAFFGHWFVVTLMVAEGARAQGIGAELLLDAQRQRDTAKLFTRRTCPASPCSACWPVLAGAPSASSMASTKVTLSCSTWPRSPTIGLR